MVTKVRGLENAGFGSSLRTIGNAYLMTRSGFPMTDAEFRTAREYAQMKLDADHYTQFANDEVKYVYLGRLIGEQVLQNRFDADLIYMSGLLHDGADEIEKEPGDYVGPLGHFYSTASVLQNQA